MTAVLLRWTGKSSMIKVIFLVMILGIIMMTKENIAFILGMIMMTMMIMVTMLIIVFILVMILGMLMMTI